MKATIDPWDKTSNSDVYLEKSIHQQCYLVYVRIGDSVMLPVDPVYQTIKDGEAMHKAPVCKLPYHLAQMLFQEMWNNGLRPSKNESSSEQIKVLTNHLEDMRAIAFESIGVNKPALK